MAEKEGDGWKNARPLGGVFENWEGDQASPSVTADGTLYFTSNRAAGVGGWDPATDQWADVAEMDMPRGESAVVVHGDEIWLIGGHSARAPEIDSDICPTVLRFNPRLNTLSRGPALPWMRAASAAANVNGRLFVLGGLRAGPSFSHDLSVLEYVPSASRCPAR